MAPAKKMNIADERIRWRKGEVGAKRICYGGNMPTVAATNSCFRRAPTPPSLDLACRSTGVAHASMPPTPVPLIWSCTMTRPEVQGVGEREEGS